MCRLPITLVLYLLIAFPPSDLRVAAQESRPLSVESLGWLAGNWQSTDPSRDSEEHWMTPKAGLMLGMHRTISRQGKPTFEFLRIVETSSEGADPNVIYYASPSGKPATPFTLTDCNEQSAVFQNSGHDFPQRIIYERQDDELTARIEGVVQGQERSIEWHWKRLPKD